MKYKSVKIVGIILILGFVTMQFLPTELPKTSKHNPNDLLTNNNIPDTIASLIKNGCYDCHSNETNYPWYSNVKPVTWLIIRDTKDGRKHLNFSDWESYSTKNKLKVLNESSDEIASKDMPFPPYLLTHKSARLSDKERSALVLWIEEFSENLLN